MFARVHLRNTSNSVEDDKMSDIYSMGVVIWETTARQVRCSKQQQQRGWDGGRGAESNQNRDPCGRGEPLQVPWDGVTNDDIELHVRGGARVPMLEVDESDEILTLLNGIIDSSLNPSPDRRPTFNSINTKFAKLIRNLLEQE